MSVISNFPDDLRPGKEFVPRWAEIDIVIKFGLWKDYTEWIDDPLDQLKYWHDLSVLDHVKVGLEIEIANKTIFQHTFTSFETVRITHKFNDEVTAPGDLTIKITNLSKLPIRDDTGSFVSGSFEIQSLKLQDIELLPLIENTLVGQDVTLSLPISTPVYSWMIKNWSTILPKVFRIKLDEIEKIKNRSRI